MIAKTRVAVDAGDHTKCKSAKRHTPRLLRKPRRSRRPRARAARPWRQEQVQGVRALAREKRAQVRDEAEDVVQAPIRGDVVEGGHVEFEDA